MNDSLAKVEELQAMLVGYATGEGAEEDEYAKLRREMIKDHSLSDDLPKFVKRCRSLSQFWGYIKDKFDTYQERRIFIWGEFEPLLRKLEQRAISPSDDSVSSTLSHLSVNHVGEIWNRAQERSEGDPEGAITLAKTLVESTCKLILDEEGVSYSEKADLPKLYYKTAEHLNLSPGQHQKELFKAILGNCQAVVGNLGAIRNEYGDAHGKGAATYRPNARHAELVVTLSGATATFLVRTWKAQP